MSKHVYKASNAREYFTRERCYITEVANDPENEALSVAIARVEPGITTAWHVLRDVDERYLIISGTGQVEIGEDQPVPIATGDVVFIPAGIRQRIANHGSDDLTFYALCTPRFTPDCYISLE
ncbi:cupin domain-containing protein [Desulfopila sp. IMCC35008]|uniref:cupin domain-containing protein n=1 Tax=Desulfopila sp. IMCC35008 TaxID=2653858 RepID=UPI0013D7A2F2|nr:cupin domain-containing protein [Desulfopila sp. IMCC35008]